MSASVHVLNLLPVYDVLFSDKHVVNQMETVMTLLEKLMTDGDFESAGTAYTALLCDVREGPGLAFSVRSQFYAKVMRIRHPR